VYEFMVKRVSTLQWRAENMSMLRQAVGGRYGGCCCCAVRLAFERDFHGCRPLLWLLLLADSCMLPLCMVKHESKLGHSCLYFIDMTAPTFEELLCVIGVAIVSGES